MVKVKQRSVAKLGVSQFESVCSCGKFHPKTECDRSADLLKMGIYGFDTGSLAETLTKHQLKTAFLNGDRQPEETDPDSGFQPFLKLARATGLCSSSPTFTGCGGFSEVQAELMQLAGGFEAAIAAAFGSQSDRFFTDAIASSPFTRRKFLQQIAIAAALTSLTNCANPETTEPELSLRSNLEKTHLKIGFLPITCATPIIMSEPLGFYQKYGLNVELVKMESWEQVRDSAIAGELDAYHMLSPMPIAMSLGLGQRAFPIALASIENINGQAIVVAKKHQGKVKSAKDFKGFKIGIPFPYSMHNLLMRYYLASSNINPDRDVELKIVPPPEGVARMKAGEIDAFLLPDGNAQQAVYEQVGFIHLLTKELWPGHPCCAFAASKDWIDQHPSTFRALNKAIIDGCNYARNPANRKEIARAIAAPEYLNQSQSVLESVLTGKFEDGQGNFLSVPDRIDFDPYPWKSFSYWITTQFVRWGMMTDNHVQHEQIADEVFLTGLARQIAKQLGQTPPTIILRDETLKFDSFDPSEPDAYLRSQIEKYGF